MRLSGWVVNAMSTTVNDRLFSIRLSPVGRFRSSRYESMPRESDMLCAESHAPDIDAFGKMVSRA